MTSEHYQDFSYERSKGQKHPIRPKLLKLADVSIAHRNRKKTKIKVKERSQSNVRDRIIDDPAYTEDISHLAIPQRRNSGPEKIENFGSLHKQKSPKDVNAKRKDSDAYKRDGSSSSDTIPNDFINNSKQKRGRSLERSKMPESSSNKREKRERSVKQKRNLSLDNNLTSNVRRSLNSRETISTKTENIEHGKTKSRIKDAENYPPIGISDHTKMQIGRRFLKGEIGIKSFNYYLLKEGLKSSKKFVEKQRNSLTGSVNPKKLISRSEENIYEEIFFKDKPTEIDTEPSLYPNCELCIQECTKENCEYCQQHLNAQQHKYSSLSNNTNRNSSKSIDYQRNVRNSVDNDIREAIPINAHILEFQSYNPSNPGVYKLETTPVAFTSDYNPIHQLNPDSGNFKEIPQRTTKLPYQQPLPPIPISRRSSRISTGPVPNTRINAKSSSSSDSLNHRYNSFNKTEQDPYDCNSYNLIYASNVSGTSIGGSQILPTYELPKIYKSDSKVSIISEYSVQSESSNRNFRCGEVSDSSLGDSMFSYTTQRRYFGSSESCRFAFECRRCSFDGEKCSFSDNCRYECRNCDCSSSYFSSDFDDINYGSKNSGKHLNTHQKSREFLNNTMDLKQNKYAQDFFKHVNDVKRSIYQAELQRGCTETTVSNPYTTIPPPKNTLNYQTKGKQFFSEDLNRVGHFRTDSNNKEQKSQQQQITYSTLPILNDVAFIHRKNASGRLLKNQPTISTSTSTSTSTSEKQILPHSEKNNHDKTYFDLKKQLKQPKQYSSLERTYKKSTGAIPKGSSATSSSSSHLSQRDSENDFLEANKIRQASRIYCKDTMTNHINDSTVLKLVNQSCELENNVNSIGNVKTSAGAVCKNKNVSPLQVKKDEQGPERDKQLHNINDESFPNSSKISTSINSTVYNLSSSLPAQTEDLELGQAQKIKLGFKKCVVDCDKQNCGNLNEDNVFYDTLSDESNCKENLHFKKVVKSLACSTFFPKPVDKQIILENYYSDNSPSNNNDSTNNSPENSKLMDLTLTNNLVKKTFTKALQHNVGVLSTESFVQPTSASITLTTTEDKVNVSVDIPMAATVSLSSLESKLSSSVCPTHITNTIIDRLKNVSELTTVSAAAAALAATKIATTTTTATVTVLNKSDEACNSADIFSRDLDIAGVTRNSSSLNRKDLFNLEKSYDNLTYNNQNEIEQSNNLHNTEKLDISNLPLPALPPKRRSFQSTKKLDCSKTKTDSLSSPSNQQITADINYAITRRESLEKSSRAFKEKLEARKMHFHNTVNDSSNFSQKPTYLFGERCIISPKKLSKTNDEIYLNKSGWVQVNKHRVCDDVLPSGNQKFNQNINDKHIDLNNTIQTIQIDNADNDKPVYAVPKILNSKIEQLISRSEARRNIYGNRTYMKPGYKIIDPQIASLLNERPGFLPVQTLIDSESAQPITPILSPPLAFQDSKSKFNKNTEKENIQTNKTNSNIGDSKVVKGMVFSRSFEYDNRRSKDTYVETFSKSFDGNLLDKPVQKESYPNFGNLTGCSPNYLTKKEPIRSQDTSPKYQQKPKKSTYINSHSISKQDLPGIQTLTSDSDARKPDKSMLGCERNGRSRTNQLSRSSRNTSFASSQHRRGVNERLNSCDSGARSDLSNDELDDEHNETTEFQTANRKSLSSQKSQDHRSLTPEPNDSRNVKNYRKQRSLTPDSQSLTIEDRRKRGSHISLSSRQNSRNNTLERKSKFGEKSISPSGSTSSSSCSIREIDTQIPIHRRLPNRNSKTADENRIRRSRSLQLTEKSPNHTTVQTHQNIASGDGSTLSTTNNTNIFQQSTIKNNNFPPTIRPNQIISDQHYLTSSRNIRSTENDRSRSFDFDYGPYKNRKNPAASSRLDFDKSRSFDEDYRELCNIGINSNTLNHLKTDLVMGKSIRKISPTITMPSNGGALQTSPQNYGTRLCDHELTYDMLRRNLDRSPIMDFSREYEVPQSIKTREIINSGVNSEINFLNNGQIFDKQTTIQTPQPVSRSSPSDSSYSIDRLHNSRESLSPESSNEFKSEVANDERLRSEYMYRMQQQQRTMGGHQGSSRGSYRKMSSCKLWPHSAIFKANCMQPQNFQVILENSNVNEFRLIRDRDGVIEKRLNSNIAGINQEVEKNVLINKSTQSNDKHTHSKTASKANKLNGIKFDKSKECYDRNKPVIIPVNINKMQFSPNTRSVVEFLHKPDSTDKCRQLRIKGAAIALGESTGNNLFDKQRSRTTNFYQKDTIFDQSLRRSTSLPTILVENIRIKPCDLTEPVTTATTRSKINLQNQTKAVSSPSLSDIATDTIQPNQSAESNKQTICSQNNIPSKYLQHIRQNLLDVKENLAEPLPLSDLKSNDLKKLHDVSIKNHQATNMSINNNDSLAKHRFGFLTWRSSKERRKTKYNRRDKCNSGDSGIQIELDSEMPEQESEQRQILTDRSRCCVRRAQSVATRAPVSTYPTQHHILKSHESRYPRVTSVVPTRSQSQPTGLHICTETFYDSDSDSVCSQPDIQIEDKGQYYPIYAEVLFQFNSAGPQELALEKGSLVEIVRKEVGPWWFGRIKHDAVLETVIEPQQGWFPKDFVRIISHPYKQCRDNTDMEKENVQPYLIPRMPSRNYRGNIATVSSQTKLLQQGVDSASSSELNRKNINSTVSQVSCLSDDSTETLKNNVIKELLETELNYVKLLSSLCTGFLPAMRKRIDIFSTESINLIFSNLESIWHFQKLFLLALEHGIESDRIAQVFLENKSGFSVYSAYCNSYPRALIELESYSRCKEAKVILEKCRLSENLPELSLSANLLAPIQRICRYPLHLAELIKHTTRQCNTLIDEVDSSLLSIPDSKELLQMALNAMKEVTETVNEGKRNSEHLARFQSSFENFEGPPLHFHSTRFFMQTDATRVSPNLWNNSYTFFLFDHQLIYCKKDILKRNHYLFKGRMFLDRCRILNLPDGKIFGTTVKNALRIYCDSRQKWFDFSFRSSSRKLRFLSTLAVERQFCGKNLFISELVGDEDINLSERGYNSDYDTVFTDDNQYNNLNRKQIIKDERVTESAAKKHNYNTMPKKSRQFNSDTSEKLQYEDNSGSLGRRKIGSWFRKSKSSNSSPKHSPTHNPSAIAFYSDSSTELNVANKKT